MFTTQRNASIEKPRQNTPFNLLYLQQSKKISNIQRFKNNRITNLKPAMKDQYLNEQFLYQRRQSILNSKFNTRMNRLLQITKENKKIHQRINAQKSLYSSRSSNRSFDSRCSERSSISKQSNSNISKNKGKSLISSKFNTKPIRHKKTTMTIQSYSIKTINQQKVQNFARIFSGTSGASLQVKSSLKSSKDYRNHPSKIQKYKQNIQLPSLVGDGLLHRIAEEIYQSKSKIKKKIIK